MKRLLAFGACAFLLQAGAQVAHAGDDFYGIVENRPEGKVGTWVIGGRSVSVTEQTDLDEEDGPLQVGACAEVELEDGVAEEIETEPAAKCGG